MRFLSSVFIIWVSALTNAVQADSTISAYFCSGADDNFPILFEEKDGEYTLLGDTNAVSSMSLAGPKVFEFRFVNPAHIGYLREIGGTWKFLFSDLGIVQTSDCKNLSNELNSVIELYASTIREGGLDGDTETLLGARGLADALLNEFEQLEVEREQYELRLEQREILLAEARKSLSVSEDLSEKRANELIEAAKQQELLNQQVAALRAELGKLQELLALSEQKDADSQTKLQNLGNRLNAALAFAASEERKRRKLEEAERIRLEAKLEECENKQ